MKILHIAPITKNQTAGLSHSVKNLLEAQSRNGFEVAVISTQSSENFFTRKIMWFSISNKNYLQIIIKNQIKKIIYDFGKPDVIIFHDLYNLKQSILLIHALFSKCKIFITPRGAFSPVALSRSYFKKKIYYYLLIKPFIKYINAFIALNKQEAKIIRQITQKKTIIISNGINDNSKIYKKYKKNYIEKSDSKIINICFLGRYDIYIKGLDYLLEGFIDYQNASAKNKIKLHLIGNHSKKNDFKSATFFNKIYPKLKIKENLIIEGPYYNENKWKRLTKMDILILPSRTEGMPNTVLEAMSIAIPCCVTKETNMSEIIKKSYSGWVFKGNKESVKILFDDIEKLPKKKFIKMGLNGLEYASRNLTWDKVCISNYE